MQRAVLVILAIFFATLSASVLAQAPPKPAYQVIVHPKNPASTVDRKFVEDAFLKKLTSWPGGELIRPVDLAADSSTRQAFTADVLHRTVDDVRRFWQQRIFAGREVPPPELASDDDVVKYVMKYEGAIGYVSANANLGGAKVVVVGQ